MLRKAGCSLVCLTPEGDITEIRFSEHYHELHAIAKEAGVDDEEDLEKEKAEIKRKIEARQQALLYGGPASDLGK